MRGRLMGATLLMLGMLVLLVAPIRGVAGCADFGGGCRSYGWYSWRSLVHWPSWGNKLLVPMAVVSVGLFTIGIVLLMKSRRARLPARSASGTET